MESTETEDFVQDRLLLDVLSRPEERATEADLSGLAGADAIHDKETEADGLIRVDPDGKKRINLRQPKGGSTEEDRQPIEERPSHGESDSVRAELPLENATSLENKAPKNDPERELPYRNGFGLGWLALAFLLQLGFITGLALVLWPSLSKIAGQAAADSNGVSNSPSEAANQNGLEQVDAAASRLHGASVENLHPEIRQGLEIEEQLRILKERTRLTALADESIAEGSRAAYTELVEYLKEGMESGGSLLHASRTEMLRVKFFYAGGNRLGPYRLPVKELFGDPDLQDEADLGTRQVIGLLRSTEHDWPVRMRAAVLLGGRSNSQVNEALVQAIQSEPHLDVLRECVYSFQENTGYRGDFFDVESLTYWWENEGNPGEL